MGCALNAWDSSYFDSESRRFLSLLRPLNKCLRTCLSPKNENTCPDFNITGAHKQHITLISFETFQSYWFMAYFRNFQIVRAFLSYSSIQPLRNLKTLKRKFNTGGVRYCLRWRLEVKLAHITAWAVGFTMSRWWLGLRRWPYPRLVSVKVV